MTINEWYYKPFRGYWEKRPWLNIMTMLELFTLWLTLIPPWQYPGGLTHPPDTIQTPSRQPQTPQNMAHFDQSKATVKKRNKLMQMSLIGCLFVSCTSHPLRQYPESLRQPPDISQTPSRHPKI